MHNIPDRTLNLYLKDINKIDNHHLKLVLKVALKYQNHGLDVLDLVQEGNIGLMKALEKFDTKRDIKFSTYAVFWIKQHIVRAIENQSKIVKLPVNKLRDINNFKIAEIKLTNHLLRKPSLKEIATELDQNIDFVTKLRNLSLPIECLDDTYENILTDDKDNILELLMTEEELLNLNKALNQLPSQDRKIIENLFGIDDKPTLNLIDLSKKLNVNRETLRRKQNDLLSKIKRRLSVN